MVVQLIQVLTVYIAFSGSQGIILALAFTCYTYGIMEFGSKTGIATIAFMISDTIYSVQQYGTLPYLNIIFYAGSLIVFVASSIKQNKKLLNELKSPKLVKMPQRKVMIFVSLIVITIALANMAVNIKSNTDILTNLIVQVLQALQILIPVTIAFRNRAMYLQILTVYIVGNINSLRILRYGSIDIVQSIETIFVMAAILIAYKSNKEIYKRMEVVET